ncbi:MAG TPA: tetratricopeptide repeat protein [Bryobacteraceae bacterium]|nr:tetratricopeptide repeat protein [Bryobacteraceae bacterium]
MKSALCVFCFAAAPLLLAQNSGTGSLPGIGSTSGGRSGNPSSIPGTQGPSTPITGDNGQTLTQPTFFAGKIVMADGQPLPYGIPILRSCFSNQRTVAFTDSKGQFSFQIGSPNDSAVLGDASDTGGPMGSRDPRSMMRGSSTNPNLESGCELRADLAGYSSTVIQLDRNNVFGEAQSMTLVLHRLANVEGTSVSATLYTAPADARKAYEKGTQSLQKGHLPDAQKDFEKAVALYPKFANAWLSLGRARERQNQTEPARDAFQKALEADPKLVEAQVELGIMAAREKKWRDAAQFLDAALKLDPVDFPQIWFTDAVADFNSGNYDGAEKSAREALKLDTAHRNPQLDQLLGMALAQKHDYAGAAEELRTYLKLAPMAADFTAVKAQLDRIEEILAANPQ